MENGKTAVITKTPRTIFVPGVFCICVSWLERNSSISSFAIFHGTIGFTLIVPTHPAPLHPQPLKAFLRFLTDDWNEAIHMECQNPNPPE